jgi:hypothetical protein
MCCECPIDVRVLPLVQGPDGEGSIIAIQQSAETEQVISEERDVDGIEKVDS